jgi:hypothetical protein
MASSPLLLRSLENQSNDPWSEDNDGRIYQFLLSLVA